MPLFASFTASVPYMILLSTLLLPARPFPTDNMTERRLLLALACLSLPHCSTSATRGTASSRCEQAACVDHHDENMLEEHYVSAVNGLLHTRLDSFLQ